MSQNKQKICVIGLGYIGLPTASLLGTKGYTVHGVDVSPKVVETINQGRIHIVEPDLDILVKSAVQSGNLTAALEPIEADIFIIAVPTPFTDGKKPDLTYVEKATRSICSYVKPGNLVILESTSPVGTTDEVVARILTEQGHAVGTDVFVAHCPERVLPGRILVELVENDRVVGGINDASTQVAVDFYRDFVRGEVLPTTAKTAEMVKLTENSFRDVNIAFANELSMICDKLDINVWELIKLANRHPRVNILQPGPGVGGHCIAVDPWFIVASAPDEAKLISTARHVNDHKPEWVIAKVKAAIFDYLQANPAKTVKDVTVACFGLAFKADIDDLRESPAVEIAKHIHAFHPGEVLLVEPNIDRLPAIFSHKFKLVATHDAVDDAKVIVLLVDHREFKDIDLTKIKNKVVIDTRGIWI